MRVLRSGVVAVVALAVFSTVSWAAVIVSDDGADWTVVSSLGGPGWTTVFNQSDSDVWGSGAPVDGSGVEFSGLQTQGQIGIFDDRITENNDLINGGTIVGGDYTSAGVYQYTFDFYNDGTYQPAELSVYFTDGTYEWYSDLSLPSTQDWTSYSGTFDWGAGSTWYDVSGLGGGSAEFASSLGSVDELGIRILYNNNVVGPQQYGFGGFTLYDNNNEDPLWAASVPEPGTYVVLSTVLMSLGFTFGRKKKQVLA